MGSMESVPAVISSGAVLLEESVVVMVAVDAEYVIRDLASELTLILDVVNRKYRLDFRTAEYLLR